MIQHSRTPHLQQPSIPSNSGGKRVPNTSTFLVIGILNHPIPRFKLGRTILRTQAEVRDYINTHDANDTSLTVADDPYESNPYWEGCYFGVAELPYGTKLMTYGIVYNVLEGLRLWLYMDRVDKAAVFEVRHEEFGAIGIGRISPHPHPPKSVGVGDRTAST